MGHLGGFFPRGAVIVAGVQLLDDSEDVIRGEHYDGTRRLLDNRAPICSCIDPGLCTVNIDSRVPTP